VRAELKRGKILCMDDQLNEWGKVKWLWLAALIVSESICVLTGIRSGGVWFGLGVACVILVLFLCCLALIIAGGEPGPGPGGGASQPLFKPKLRWPRARSATPISGRARPAAAEVFSRLERVHQPRPGYLQAAMVRDHRRTGVGQERSNPAFGIDFPRGCRTSSRARAAQ